MQISGSWAAEVELGGLADAIAERVVAALHAAARDATAELADPGPGGYPLGDPGRVRPGSGDVYEREEDR